MNYAIFTYADDADCLALCVQQIRDIDSNAQLYVFDDGKKTIPVERIPDGVHYKVTWFNRKGNLNGLECVRGMLSSMLDIPGDDPVIKIDADTLLMSLSEIQSSLNSRGMLAGGMQCSVPLAFAGCCYWLTKHAIKEALTLLAQREWPEGIGEPYQEDLTIARIMMFLFGRASMEILEWKNARHLIGVKTCDHHDLSQISIMSRSGITAVHCGQMDYYEPIVKATGCTIREACARIMKRIIDPALTA